MKNDTLLVGKGSSVEFIPPHKLLDDLHLALSRLAQDPTTTPDNIVEALACIAAVIKSFGQPTMIIKNPYKDPPS